MSERERFEAIVSSSPYEKSIRRWPDDATTHAWPGSYRDLDVDFAWLVLQDFLARSGQAASGSSQGARSDVQNGVGQPEAPTAASLTAERGWLIEHSGEMPGATRFCVSWLRVVGKFDGYGAKEFGFTHDANDALRFARREDAEAVLAMHLGASPPDWYRRPYSVTEHMWPAPPARSGAGSEEGQR